MSSNAAKELRSVPENAAMVGSEANGTIAYAAQTFAARQGMKPSDELMLKLVGESESESGKTTTARLLMRLYEPISGVLRFQGVPVASHGALWACRRHMQYKFHP